MAKIKATRAQRHQRREAKAARRRRRLTVTSHRRYRGPESRAAATAAMAREGERKMGLADGRKSTAVGLVGRLLRRAS